MHPSLGHVPARFTPNFPPLLFLPFPTPGSCRGGGLQLLSPAGHLCCSFAEVGSSCVPRGPPAAPSFPPSPACPPSSHRCGLHKACGAACQAGWSKPSAMSSNGGWLCSEAERLSPELSFCSGCPWLFPSPSAFAFPPARREQKSSESRRMTKWMLPFPSSSAFLPAPGCCRREGRRGGAEAG